MHKIIRAFSLKLLKKQRDCHSGVDCGDNVLASERKSMTEGGVRVAGAGKDRPARQIALRGQQLDTSDVGQTSGVTFAAIDGIPNVERLAELT